MKKHYKEINGCSQSTFQAHLAEIMRRNHISTQGGEYANIYEAFFQQLTEIYDLAGKPHLDYPDHIFPYFNPNTGDSISYDEDIDIQRRLSDEHIQSDIDEDEDDVFESLGVSKENEVHVSNECVSPSVCPIIGNNECHAVDDNVVELDEIRPGPSRITGISNEIEVSASLRNPVVSTTTSRCDTNSGRPAANVKIDERFVTIRRSKKKSVLKPMVHFKNDEENLPLCAGKKNCVVKNPRGPFIKKAKKGKELVCCPSDYIEVSSGDEISCLERTKKEKEE